MPLRLSNITGRLSDMPMASAVVALAAGILSGERWQLPVWFAAAGFSLCCVMGYVCSRRRSGMAYVAAALVLAGMMLPELHRPLATVPYGRSVVMRVEVVAEPADRGDYAVAEGRITKWRDMGRSRSASDRVWLWIGCDSVACGDCLTVEASLSEHISRHADYSAMMRRRGYVGSLSIGAGNILHMDRAAVSSLQAAAVARIRALGLREPERAVVEAMTTGSRAGISPELRRSYARSGIAHVLALSGLHLGIVAMAVNMLLAWLSLLHGGHVVRNVMVVAAIWVFAVMGGMSPSVVRAATMFSILQLSLAASSVCSSINALAATVFLMLIFDSSYLFDTGFQLSALAVAGILLWGVPLSVRLRCGRRAVDALVSAVVVGLCAALWTMPVVSHIFGYVSWAGIVVSPLAILTATVIVALGAVAIVLPEGWLAAPLRTLLDHAAGLQNAVAECFDREWCATDWRMDMGEAIAVYVLFAAITFVIWSADRKKKVTLPDYDDYIRH
ncbi:MAG: ComEC/Rec2 family competence protein [Alistipes sp.]|nr:ComEC/Rec2 family competence protein [Alistipes sp.]